LAQEQELEAMHKTLLFLCAAFVAFGLNCPAEDLEALSKSPVWQVRYCVPEKIDTPGADARRILERLSADGDRRVAVQAFAPYSWMFVELDRGLVRKAFARGDFDLEGIDVADRKVFETPEYWIGDLKRSKDAVIQARAVRATGMCGTAAHVATLSGYTATTNPHLLMELALAFHRLGDAKKYLAAIDALLALPLKEAFSYQTRAVDCLIQTHPDRARAAWKRVHEQFEKAKDAQPNWVYPHIVQEARLP
jgi:hypothetical protein